MWGRCRSGCRWFWAARWYDDAAGKEHTRHGWTDYEPGALSSGKAAALSIAGGRPAALFVRHGVAASVLKAVNAAKRAEKAPAGGQSADAVEYLYAVDHGGEYNDFTACVVAFPITRRTAKRVYYLRDERVGFVDRAALEANGQVHRAARWAFESYTILYASPPELDQRLSAERHEDLGILKQRMADAHPDRGGTEEDFIAARAVYQRARSIASHG